MTRFYYNGCTWSLAQRFHRQHRGRPVKVGPLKVDVPVRSTRKRALLVGISSSRHGPLFGARKDVLAMEKILIELYGYDSKDIVVMLDGCQGCFVPTRANLIREIDNLVRDAREGDRFCFHFSGHTTQVPNRNNSEEDGMDEAILPCDDERYEKLILDDELRRRLVDPLPVGASLVAIFDTCHSASLLDLPHMRCNRVYVPWSSKGDRRSLSLWSRTVRRNAQIPMTANFRILDKKRTDTKELASREASISIPGGKSPSPRISVKGRTSSVKSTEAAPNSPSGSTGGTKSGTFTSFYYDSPTLPMERTSSPEPMSATYECDGFCCHNQEEGPYIVALGAAQDSQVAWDDERGGSMTSLLVDILRENPHRSLKDVVTDISFRVHTTLVRLHEFARQKRKRAANGQKQDTPTTPSEHTGTLSSDHETFAADSDLSSSILSEASSETNVTPEISDSSRKDSDGIDLEMNNFQDPQLASNRRLDMNAPFLL